MIWKSNLHTYDFSAHDAKMLQDTTSDGDRLIDPRQSLVYTTHDHDLQLHTCPEDTSSPLKDLEAESQESLTSNITAALGKWHLSTPLNSKRQQSKLTASNLDQRPLKYV